MKEVYKICFSEFMEKVGEKYPFAKVTDLTEPNRFTGAIATVEFDFTQDVSAIVGGVPLDGERDFFKDHPVKILMFVKARDPRLPRRFYPWECEEVWYNVPNRFTPRDLTVVSSINEEKELSEEDLVMLSCVEDDLPYRTLPMLKELTMVLNRAFRLE